MVIHYEFIPEYKLEEEKEKKMMKSYAGKILEICGSRTLVIYLDEDDEIRILGSDGRLSDPTDFSCDTY